MDEKTEAFLIFNRRLGYSFSGIKMAAVKNATSFLCFNNVLKTA
jgi:hypothetical protein